MLPIGIIGLGPEWERLYRPALGHLARRLRVTAVYDAVPSRAEQAAAELRAAPAFGIRALLQRHDVKGVLILDEAWQGLWPLRFATEIGKPAYVARPVTGRLPLIEPLCARAAAQNVLLVPEFRLRALPVTTRVHELVATHLGAVEHLDLALGPAADRLAALVSAIDWCSEVVRSVPADVALRPAGPHAARCAVTFRRASIEGGPVTAEIALSAAGAESAAPSNEPPMTLVGEVTAALRCRCGTIEISGETELHWKCAAREAHERLDKEQPGVELLLGHFARRVVGGLVPVPGLDDVCRILRLLSRQDADVAAALGIERSERP